jgi:hypothetical protein
MARTPKAPTPDDEVMRLRTQTARLRARVEELEAELSLRAPGSASRGSSRADALTDYRVRVMDGASELIRGLTSFSVGALRATTNIVGGVVGKAYDPNQSDEANTVWDRVERLPVELVSLFMEGISRALEVPIRAISPRADQERRGKD